MRIVRRSLVVALGWALVQGQIQFSLLITNGQGTAPIWFLAIFLLAVEASLLLEGIEKALQCWLFSLLLSVIIVFLLLSLPLYLGVLLKEFASLLILGSVQPVAAVLIIIAPLGLLGCFVGQILRNRMI